MKFSRQNKTNVMNLLFVSLLIIISSSLINASISNFEADEALGTRLEVSFETNTQLQSTINLFDVKTGERLTTRTTEPGTSHSAVLRGLTPGEEYSLFIETTNANEQQIDLINDYRFMFIPNFNFQNPLEYSGLIDGTDFAAGILIDDTTEESQEETESSSDNTEQTTDEESSSQSTTDSSTEPSGFIEIKNAQFISDTNKINITFDTNKQSRVLINYFSQFSSIESVLMQGQQNYNTHVDNLISGTEYTIQIRACNLNDLTECTGYEEKIRTKAITSTIQHNIKTNIKDGKVGRYLVINGTAEAGSKITVFRNNNFNFAIPDRATQNGEITIGDDEAVYGLYENGNAGNITYTILIEKDGQVDRIEKSAQVSLIGPELHVTALPPTSKSQHRIWGYTNKPSDVVIRVNNASYATFRTDGNPQNVFNHLIDFSNTNLITNELDQRVANVEILARDDFSNIEIEEFIVIIDDKAPEIQLDPDYEDIMRGAKEFHQPLLELKGYAGEPYVRLIAVNFGDGANSVGEFVFDASAREPLAQIELNDGSYLNVQDERIFDIGVQNLKAGNVAEDVVVRLKKYVEENRADYAQDDQISAYSLIDISLSNSIKDWITPVIDNSMQVYEVVADENGNFKLPMAMLQKSDEEAPYRNQIHILAIDPVGNFKNHVYDLSYDPGEGFWSVGQKSKFPNSIYAMDWKDTDLPVTLNYEFIYTGISKEKIKDIALRVSPEPNQYSQYWTVGGRKIRYDYDETEGVLKAEIPIQFNKLAQDTNVLQLPDEIDVELEVIITSNIDDPNLNEEIRDQIATGRRHIKQTLTVEKPLDHRKWLNPSLVEDLLGVLDKVHTNLAKAIDVSKKVATYTTALCGATTFLSQLPFFKAANSKKTIFAICDRVACPYIPGECSPLGGAEEQDGILTRSFDDSVADSTVKYQYIGNRENNPQYMEQLKDIGATGTPLCGEKQNLIVVDSTSSTADIDSEARSGAARARLQSYRTTREYKCIAESKEEFRTADIETIPAGQNSCFQAGEPNYDDLKCLGRNDYYGEPAANLISSLQCGCVSGVVGNLQKYGQVVNTLNNCLRQVQLGRFSGAYCERLFAHHTCDLLASGFRKIREEQHKVGTQKITGENSAVRPASNVGIVASSIKNQQAVGDFFTSRYQNSGFTSKFSLSSGEFVHSLCTVAITGNYDDLSAFFESSVNLNVPPQVFPLIGESNIIYQSQMTGEMDIKYRINSIIIGGGNQVEYKLELQCDRNAPGGEWCPQDRVEVKTVAQGVVNKNQQLDRGFVFVDKGAKWWYNKAVLEYKYNFNNRQTVRSMSTGISKRGEPSQQCSFNIYQGWSCQTIDPFDMGYVKIFPSIREGLDVYPKGQNIVYPGDTIRGIVSIEKINYNENDLWLNIEQRIPKDYIGPKISDMSEEQVESWSALRRANTLMVPLSVLNEVSTNTFIFNMLQLPLNREGSQSNIISKYVMGIDREISEAGYDALRINSPYDNLNDVKVNSVEISNLPNLVDAVFNVNDETKNWKAGNPVKFEFATPLNANDLQIKMENIAMKEGNTITPFVKIQTVKGETEREVSFSPSLTLATQTVQGFAEGELFFNVSLVRNVDGGQIYLDLEDKPVISFENEKAEAQTRTIKVNLADKPLSTQSCASKNPTVQMITPNRDNTYMCAGADNQVKAIVFHSCSNYFEDRLNNNKVSIVAEVTIAGTTYTSVELVDKYSDGVINVTNLFGTDFTKPGSSDVKSLTNWMRQEDRNELARGTHRVKVIAKVSSDDDKVVRQNDAGYSWVYSNDANICQG